MLQPYRESTRLPAGIPYYSIYAISCEANPVRCPGHTIQFSGYGYAEYIKEVLGVVGIDVNSLEWKHYESWTPYLATSRKD
jgi:hypothetical protein